MQNRLSEKAQEFYFGNIKCEVSIRNQAKDAELPVGYISLKFKRRVLVRDMNLCHQPRINMYNHEIT